MTHILETCAKGINSGSTKSKPQQKGGDLHMLNHDCVCEYVLDLLVNHPLERISMHTLT